MTAERRKTQLRKGRSLTSGGSCLSLGGALQGLGPVDALPGEGVALAAEVAVGGGLTEDRAVQVEVLAEGARAEIELGFDQA